MYSTLSEVPDEVKYVISEHYREHRNMVKKFDKESGKRKSLCYVIDGLMSKDMSHIDLSLKDNIKIAISHYKTLNNKMHELNELITKLDAMEREIDELEDYFELYMKDNGFDMDARDIDEELYNFIHDLKQADDSEDEDSDDEEDDEED